MPLTRRKKLIYSLFTVILVLAVALGLMKILLSRNNPKFYGNYEDLMFLDDTLLGYAAKPCTDISSTKVIKGDTIYQADHTIDCNGLRSTGTASPTANKHLLFFGCSFTFGEGLPDSSTFPYLMNDSHYHAYNFGMPGYGPQQMLVRLEDGKLADVKEDSGIAIYTILPDHVYRATGAPYVLYYWGDRMPYYTKDPRLERHTSFQRSQPLRTLWYKALGFCGLMNVESIAKPEVTEKDIELMVAIVKRSTKLYLQRYPGSKFYILLYPSAAMKDEYRRLRGRLLKEELPVLDYPWLFAMDSSHTIPGDGHPNALANKLIVEQLRKDLNQ